MYLENKFVIFAAEEIQDIRLPFEITNVSIARHDRGVPDREHWGERGRKQWGREAEWWRPSNQQV
jgi:hypothetical protein